MPGYGYAAVSKDKSSAWGALVRDYLRGRPTLMRAFVLVDGRHGVKESDEETMKRLDSSAVSYAIVLTKRDEVKNVDQATASTRRWTPCASIPPPIPRRSSPRRAPARAFRSCARISCGCWRNGAQPACRRRIDSQPRRRGCVHRDRPPRLTARPLACQSRAMETHYNRIAAGDVGRIAALSDGIFAFAATVLVLEVHTPDNLSVHSEAQLLAALAGIAPHLLTWLLSLMTLGIFWVGQQAQLNQLERADRNVTWLHFVFLAVVTVLPFSTRLLDRIHDVPGRLPRLLGQYIHARREPLRRLGLYGARRADPARRCAANFARNPKAHRHRSVALCLGRARRTLQRYPRHRIDYPHPAQLRAWRRSCRGSRGSEGPQASPTVRNASACIAPTLSTLKPSIADFEQPMEIHFGAQTQERRAETDRRAVHEHEFPRDGEIAALLAQRLHHGGDLAPAIFARPDAVGDRANAIVEVGPQMNLAQMFIASIVSRERFLKPQSS